MGLSEDKKTKDEVQKSAEKCEALCSCANPCNCLRPYKVSLRVVTRLGAIPVEGVRLEFKNKKDIISVDQPIAPIIPADGPIFSGNGPIFSGDGPIFSGDEPHFPSDPQRDKNYVDAWTTFKSNSLGLFLSFTSRKPELEFSLHYVNTDAGLKEEKVKITLNNLLPACRAMTQVNANIEHKIEKILNVRGDDQDKDFVDNYKLVIDQAINDQDSDKIAYYNSKVEIAEGATPPTLSDDNNDSYFTLEPAKHPRLMEISLNISLATFSLLVPYMNQNAGDVHYGECTVPVKEETTDENKSKTKAKTEKKNLWYHKNVGGAYQLKPNKWSGEGCCTPTSMTMILKYYGISAYDKDNVYIETPAQGAQVTGVGSNDLVLDRLSVVAEFVNKNTTVTSFWDLNKVFNSVVTKKETQGTYTTHTPISHADTNTATKRSRNILNDGYKETDKHILNKDGQASVNETLKATMPALANGHPIQTSIKGDHAMVIRGLVFKRDETEFWAICNDPYGTLASEDADYSTSLASSYPYVWYGDNGSGSSKRPFRNVNDEMNTASSTKGRHVYYNENVRTRTGPKGSAAMLNFKFIVCYQFKRNSESTDRKQYVQPRLLKGE